jgi:putative thioredoxin
MGDVGYVLEGTRENFSRLVLENSNRGPVLVHFWAEWAGPCHRLAPLLAGLARAYGGRLLLVTLDTDAHNAVAREHGVNSLPTVKLFLKGQVVETVHGYQPEGEWRRLIDRHLGRPADPRLLEALRLYRSGQVDEGLARLAQAALDRPDDPRLPVTLGKLLMAQGRLDQAEAVLAGLPLEMRGRGEAGALLVHLGLLKAARDAPPRHTLVDRLAADPADHDARYALAALALVGDEYEEALEQLLAVVRGDDGAWRHQARRAMLALFDLLGSQDERVGRFRSRLLEVPG